MSLIEVRDLHFRYNSEDRALKGVSLDIEKGEFVCILGHNGSGKSTLAKLLVGLLEPRKGTISIEGTILNEDSVDELRKKIGIVFQNPDNQFVGITVKDDIAFGLENRQVEREEMLKLIDEYSTKVNMHDFLDRNPESLSGGEKQRVAIAGILAMNPEIIIFDEATSMLDPRGVREVMDVINNLKSKKTIISITHNLQEAIKADKVIVMNDGVIVLEGKPEEVFTHFDEIKNSKLDILDSMKILEMVDNSSINRKEEVKKALWELTYQK
ncbi:MAG: energy-coupling factor transporter ATPase [Bacilli bacterium]|nr:energy-coupling factor transporter ATPase [Bacilli bacterium]